MGKIVALFLVILLSVSPALTEVAWAQEPSFNMALLDPQPRLSLTPQRAGIQRDANDWLPWATTGECPFFKDTDTRQQLFNAARSEEPILSKLQERFSREQAVEIRNAIVDDLVEERVMPAGTRLAFMLSGCPALDKVLVVRDMPSWYVKLSDGTEVYAPKDCLNFSAVDRNQPPTPVTTSNPVRQLTQQVVNECWDTNRNRFKDTDEDRNRDGLWDTHDCRGERGEQGSPGRDGINGAGSTPGDNTNIVSVDKGGGCGKGCVAGIIIAAAAIVACLFKCPDGKGVSVSNNTTTIINNPPVQQPPPAQPPPAQPPPQNPPPVGGPTSATNGPGNTGNPGTSPLPTNNGGR